MRQNTTPQKSETDVLVVGAGPTGLTMACELLRRGISCRIIDKAEAPGMTSRAVGVQPRTLELFDNMGIIEQAISEGVPGLGVNLYDGDTPILHMDVRLLADPSIPYPYVLMLPQSNTEHILIDLLHTLGGTVERSRELVDIQQHADMVIATVNNTQDNSIEEIHARWLIGCDGAHSRVRKTLGFAFEGNTYDEEFLLADVDLDWNRSHDTVHVWLHHGGEFAAMPMPDNHWRLFADVSVDGKDAPRASLELFQQLMRERTGDTTTTISNPIWMSNFKINRRMVTAYRHGRIFLAGDAAHIHSPFGGQGMNTGIQDAYNLAWKLALVLQGNAAETLLDTYQVERMPIAHKVLHDTHRNTSVVTSKNRMIQFVRNHVIVPLFNLDVVQQKLLRANSELDLNYRTSPLSQSYGWTVAEKPVRLKRQDEKPSTKDWLDFRKAPHAGDRAPDSPCLHYPSLSPTSLFQQLRGTASTLLLFSGLNPTQEGCSHLVKIAHQVEALLNGDVKTCLIISTSEKSEKPANLEWDGNGSILLDPEHKLHTLYGAGTPSLYFIRPDGYIGFRGQPAREEPLLTYLHTLFLLSE